MNLFEGFLVVGIFGVLSIVAVVMQFIFMFGFFLFGSGLSFIRPDGSHPFIGREPIALLYLLSGLLIMGVIIYGMLWLFNAALMT